MPSIRDYIIENWETILTYVVFISIVIILTDRAWCIQQCLDRFCGIPSNSQVKECFIKCSVPEFLANPLIPQIIIYIVFIMIIIFIIVSIRRGIS